MRKKDLAVMLSGLALFTAGLGPALAQERDQQQGQTREQEEIFGSQLMTDQEQAEYRARMRAADTEKERRAIRAEHHQRMRERAASQGFSLPAEPPGIGGGAMRREGDRGQGPARGGKGGGPRGGQGGPGR